MSVFHLTNKVTLGETSKYGPSLNTIGGNLVLGWIGLDDQMNTLASTDGVHWGNKKTAYLNVEGSADNVGPPSIGAGGGSPPDSGSLFLAFRNSGGNGLWIATYFTNGAGITGSYLADEYTDHAPSLSSQYLAWTGSGNPQLNVSAVGNNNEGRAQIVGKITSSESSDGGPCLCDFNGETLIGWRGSGNFNISVAQVSGGNIVNKVVLGESSDFGPALAGVGSNLYIAFTGSGNPQLNIMSSPNGYKQFGGKAVLSDASDSGPALASYNNALYLAWRGSGNNNLNVAQVEGPGLGGL